METSQDHMDTDIGRSGSKEGKGEKTEGIQFESDGKPVKRRGFCNTFNLKILKQPWIGIKIGRDWGSL